MTARRSRPAISAKILAYLEELLDITSPSQVATYSEATLSPYLLASFHVSPAAGLFRRESISRESYFALCTGAMVWNVFFHLFVP